MAATPPPVAVTTITRAGINEQSTEEGTYNVRLDARLVRQHQTSLSKAWLGNIRLSYAHYKIISCNALVLCTSDTMSLLARRGRILTPTHAPKHISRASLHEHAHTVLIGKLHLFSLQ
jgi:hypothetical protein